MKKRIVGILALLLASALAGVTQNKNRPDHSEGPNAQQEKRETFKMTRIGQKMGPGGAHLSFRTFEGSSGTIVIVTYGTLASPDKATTELHLWLQSAKKLLQDEQKKNPAGQVIGQRIVATFVGQKETEYTAILWTNGSDCFRIQAPSFAVASYFEQRINSGVDPAE